MNVVDVLNAFIYLIVMSALTHVIGKENGFTY